MMEWAWRIGEMKHTWRKKKYLEQTVPNPNFLYQIFRVVLATGLLYFTKFGNYLQNSHCDSLKVQEVLITECLCYTVAAWLGRENTGYVDGRYFIDKMLLINYT